VASKHLSAAEQSQAVQRRKGETHCVFWRCTMVSILCLGSVVALHRLGSYLDSCLQASKPPWNIIKPPPHLTQLFIPLGIKARYVYLCWVASISYGRLCSVSVRWVSCKELYAPYVQLKLTSAICSSAFHQHIRGFLNSVH